MTEAVKYIVFPIVGMVALLYLFPILFNNWREEKDAENKAAETEFLLMADLSSKESRQFMEAESNNERLAVVVNIARLRGAYAPITLPGLTYAENLRELTRLIVNLKPYKGE